MPHFECGAFDHSATSPARSCFARRRLTWARKAHKFAEAAGQGAFSQNEAPCRGFGGCRRRLAVAEGAFPPGRRPNAFRRRKGPDRGGFALFRINSSGPGRTFAQRVPDVGANRGKSDAGIGDDGAQAVEMVDHPGVDSHPRIDAGL